MRLRFSDHESIKRRFLTAIADVTPTPTKASLIFPWPTTNLRHSRRSSWFHFLRDCWSCRHTALSPQARRPWPLPPPPWCVSGCFLTAGPHLVPSWYSEHHHVADSATEGGRQGELSNTPLQGLLWLELEMLGETKRGGKQGGKQGMSGLLQMHYSGSMQHCRRQVVLRWSIRCRPQLPCKSFGKAAGARSWCGIRIWTVPSVYTVLGGFNTSLEAKGSRKALHYSGQMAASGPGQDKSAGWDGKSNSSWSSTYLKLHS